jgi:hypothetical protein
VRNGLFQTVQRLIDGDNDFGRMQGNYNLRGKFDLDQNALEYAVAGQRELFTASWTIAASYRDESDNVRKVKISSSVAMQIDLWDQKEHTNFLNLIASLMSIKIAEISKEKKPSIVVSIEIANDQRDKYLAHPVLSYSFLNFHEFSAADFLS